MVIDRVKAVAVTPGAVIILAYDTKTSTLIASRSARPRAGGRFLVTSSKPVRRAVHGKRRSVRDEARLTVQMIDAWNITHDLGGEHIVADIPADKSVIIDASTQPAVS